MSQLATAEAPRLHEPARDTSSHVTDALAPLEYFRMRGSADQMAQAVVRLRANGWQTAGPVEADASESWIVAVRRNQPDDRSSASLGLAT